MPVKLCIASAGRWLPVLAHIFMSYSYQGIDSVPVEQIRLLKADQKYVRAYTADADFIINETLKGLEQEFAHLFVRIHRNALVAKRCYPEHQA